MDLIENNTYRYIAVAFGGLFLVPQIILGYKRGRLEDLSSITVCFITITSLLWTYYMYEMEYVMYVYISGFICLNSIILIMMQIYYYYKRFKLHVKTFESKPKTESKPEPISQIVETPVPIQTQVPIILQMPQLQPQKVDTDIAKEEIVERRLDITDLKTEPTVI